MPVFRSSAKQRPEEVRNERSEVIRTLSLIANNFVFHNTETRSKKKRNSFFPHFRISVSYRKLLLK